MEIELQDGRKVNLESRDGKLFIEGTSAAEILDGALVGARAVLSKEEVMAGKAMSPTGVRVGFTGTSQGMTGRQRFALLTLLSHTHVLSFHHGDCVGADAEAHQLVDSMVRFPDEKNQPKLGFKGKRNFPIIVHPPSNPKKRAYCQASPEGKILVRPEADYLVRDRSIVDGTDVLVACPKSETRTPHSGTWYTVNYAVQAHKPVVIILPDGRVKRRDSKGEEFIVKLWGL